MLSDAELLERMSGRRSTEFAELFDRHSTAVFRYAWGQLRNDHDAQEVLQETFLTAWSRRDVLRLVDQSALPWLLVTARNHCRNLSRREKRRATATLLEGDGATSQDTDSSERLSWVLDAIAALSPQDRRVCELCLIDGLSYRDAALQLGSTASAVGKRLERARARIRTAVYGND